MAVNISHCCPIYPLCAPATCAYVVRCLCVFVVRGEGMGVKREVFLGISFFVGEKSVVVVGVVYLVRGVSFCSFYLFIYLFTFLDCLVLFAPVAVGVFITP